MNPVSDIHHEAAKCVACGLCLPRCPTYGLLHDEAESPRGRLALMLALAKNDLPLEPRLESHLARCLGCRACERVCPSNVAYGKALDATRALIETSRGISAASTSKAARLLRWLVDKPDRTRTLGGILRLYQKSGLQWLMRTSRALRLFRLAELEADLPPVRSPRSFAEVYPVSHAPKGRVALFTGCLAQIADQQVLISAIRLLNRIGYEVHVPPGQGCCGALHLHDGQTGKAAELMRRNILAFAGAGDVILGVASGCTATLGEYAKYLEDDAALPFSARIMDINQFIAQQSWPSDISFRPLAKRIAVHDPCTLSNVLRQEDKPYALLARIPGAEIIPLADNAVCCGAAGSYHLTQVRIARQLRAPKIAQLERLGVDMLATSNSGCAMYLATGLRAAGLAIEVTHPVVLLERQIQ
ncbi:MAG: (Fe-S)-binding protein [Sulfuricaulis sp.]